MFADWIRKALAHKGISGAELARQMTKKLGRSIDRAAVNKMMIANETARTKRRKVSADELMAIAEITGYPAPLDDTPQLVTAPLISWVQAGNMEVPDAVDDFDSAKKIAVPGLDPGDWVALEVEGDSMNRISPPGSVIIVNRRDKRLVPNACYVVQDEQGAATYKRWRSDPSRFEPVSTNPDHEALFPQDGQSIRVLGRVRMSLIKM